MQALWKDGPLAEKMLVPGECCTVIKEPISASPAQLAAVSGLSLAYGALLKGEVKAGSTIVINGGGGSFGSLAVLTALAVGVAKVQMPNMTMSAHTHALMQCAGRHT